LLDEAAAAFRAAGAGWYLAEAETELGRIAGRTSTSGLTAAEQRVADLVAAGRTNREVAAELVVSVKTVESALTRVYAKLGLTSRSQLAARAAPRDH
jgi:DNA-binding CsgD family transcriptional regulator